MKALSVAVGGLVLLVQPAFGQSVSAPSNVPAPIESEAFLKCFQEVSKAALSKRPTPERYKLIADGVCLDEERKLLSATEAYLKRMDGGRSDVTERSMQAVRRYHAQLRTQRVAEYTFLYEMGKD